MLARYYEAFNEIHDCPTNLDITQYRRGLPVRHRLRDFLTMIQPPMLELLMQRINEHIRVEDDAVANIVKRNRVVTDRKIVGKVHVVEHEENYLDSYKRERIRDPRHDKSRYNNQAHNPQDEEEEARLSDTQRRFNSRFYCTFHNEKGHRMEDCVPLKQHLEELVVVGHLDRYIDGSVRAIPLRQAEPDGLGVMDAPP
ncbi:uncharacterized protein LOC114283495 [Camellia sinensis]|uniref:uncharacterized protein LOC114283495 n=1 Tax=Camellia sinensis TaxID=4442 RepID=UPI0010355858|nr:uncharacterized protein LOC114283495 [Camellia sinensis]